MAAGAVARKQQHWVDATGDPRAVQPALAGGAVIGCSVGGRKHHRGLGERLQACPENGGDLRTRHLHRVGVAERARSPACARKPRQRSGNAARSSGASAQRETQPPARSAASAHLRRRLRARMRSPWRRPRGAGRHIRPARARRRRRRRREGVRDGGTTLARAPQRCRPRTPPARACTPPRPSPPAERLRGGSVSARRERQSGTAAGAHWWLLAL